MTTNTLSHRRGALANGSAVSYRAELQARIQAAMRAAGTLPPIETPDPTAQIEAALKAVTR